MSFLVNEEQCVKKAKKLKIETNFTNCSGAVLKLILRILWHWILLLNTEIYVSSIFFVDL